MPISYQDFTTAAQDGQIEAIAAVVSAPLEAIIDQVAQDAYNQGLKEGDEAGYERRIRESRQHEE